MFFRHHMIDLKPQFGDCLGKVAIFTSKFRAPTHEAADSRNHRRVGKLRCEGTAGFGLHELQCRADGAVVLQLPGLIRCQCA